MKSKPSTRPLAGGRALISRYLFKYDAAFNRIRSVARFIPGARTLLRIVGEAAVPRDKRVWARVAGGAGAGMWLLSSPRVGATYVRGAIEPHVQAEFTRSLRPGMVVGDVGANIGFFSLIAARLVSPDGGVYAFEPDPHVFEILQANVDRNGFGKLVHPIRTAITEHVGEAGFVPARPDMSPDRGTGHLAREPSDDPASVRVSSTTLDKFFARLETVPDLVKIDVEGLELEVLSGSRRLLATRRTMWIVECHESAAGVADVFEGSGYAIRTLDTGPPLHIIATPFGSR